MIIWQDFWHFQKGYFYIQDISSMLVGELADPKKGDRVIDVCAAPGGKATELGSRIGEGGMLLANDISNFAGEGAAAQPGNPGSGTSSRDERGSGKISNLVSGLF